MSVTTLQWAVTGYSLVGAAVIITSGSLGDVFGRKRIFQLGLLLFVASCVLIALSTTGGMVIAGRLIQGAAGSTILACGLSLLSVANSGQAQLRAVSLWGAAAAVGAAAGPLLGGVCVEVTGWQGLFWVDAVVAVVCIVHHRRHGDRVARSQPTSINRLRRNDPRRPDTGTAHPRAEQRERLGLDLAGDPWFTGRRRCGVRLLRRGRTTGQRSLARPCAATQPNSGRFHCGNPHRRRHDQRAHVPLEPLLPGSRKPLALRRCTPDWPPCRPRSGSLRWRRSFPGWLRSSVVGSWSVPASRSPPSGFAAIGLTQSSWAYSAFVLPLIAVAIGMGLSNGPASSAATAAVPANQVGEASGVSNMARYIGAAVATALAASIYSSVIASRTARRVKPGSIGRRAGHCLLGDGRLQRWPALRWR